MVKKAIIFLSLCGLHVGAIDEVKHVIHINQEKTYCGTVLSIESALRKEKHGTNTKYHLLVNFDEIGTRLVDVTPETFYTRSEGTRVCFDLSNRFVERGTGKVSILGITCLIVLGTFYLVVFAYLAYTFLDWLLGDNYNDTKWTY